ncbi:unnamed protein product, partial [Oikopleura dioica]
FGFGYGCYKWLRGKRSTRSETVIASETNQETSGNAAVNSSDDLETSELTNVVRKSFGFGYGCFQWLRKLVSSRSDTEPANDGTNSSSDAESVELTNVKKSVAAGQTDSCIQEVDATDDEFLNRPRSPSPTVSEFTDVTPSRPRKPIARDLSESSATPQESTPPRRQKIVKTRCPPYRSLANKNRKSPVHNKKLPAVQIPTFDSTSWTSAESEALQSPHLDRPFENSTRESPSRANSAFINDLPSLSITSESRGSSANPQQADDAADIGVKPQRPAEKKDETDGKIELTAEDKAEFGDGTQPQADDTAEKEGGNNRIGPIRRSGRKRMPTAFYTDKRKTIYNDKSQRKQSQCRSHSISSSFNLIPYLPTIRSFLLINHLNTQQHSLSTAVNLPSPTKSNHAS